MYIVEIEFDIPETEKGYVSEEDIQEYVEYHTGYKNEIYSGNPLSEYSFKAESISNVKEIST